LGLVEPVCADFGQGDLLELFDILGEEQVFSRDMVGPAFLGPDPHPVTIEMKHNVAEVLGPRLWAASRISHGRIGAFKVFTEIRPILWQTAPEWGAGFLAFGLVGSAAGKSSAGMNLVLGVDSDHDAIDSFRANRPRLDESVLVEGNV